MIPACYVLVAHV